MSKSYVSTGIGSSSTAAGPSSFPSQGAQTTDLWSDILRSADKKKVYGRKNVIVLSERHHGRKHLLTQILGTPNSDATRRRKRPSSTLALGYEVLQVRDEGDEEAVPPTSVFFPPGSEGGGVGLLKAAVPPSAIPDTAVMVVLDWTRPGGMAKELMSWLKWIEEWAGDSDHSEEMRDRLQSHLQNYSEPSVPSPSNSTSAIPSTSSYSASAPLLPLGPGTLTLNPHGIPIIVVCTKADLMESGAEGSGMKGAAWEERCDWAQQVIRTICLSYGAALFYTSSTQPSTYTLLRAYLLHRLHSSPSSLPQSTSPTSPSTSFTTSPPPPTTRFPFPYRANVLDRDAVMVPSGWDTWGKINVLRDNFDPAGILAVVEKELQAAGEGADGERLEGVWARMIPDPLRNKPNNAVGSTSTVEPEQSFLSRQYDLLQKDPNRDPRAAFRQPTQASTPASSTGGPAREGDRYGGYGGVVGPLASSGGLSLPGVEKAMLEMEGQGAEDLKEKFAKMGRKDGIGAAGSVGRSVGVSPTMPASGERASGAGAGVPNEALHSFFQGLLASKGKTSAGAGVGGLASPKTVGE